MADDTHVVANLTISQTAETPATERRSNPMPRRRPRALTVLKLEWIAERARKIARIKEEIATGKYHVDSHELARVLIGSDGE